MAWNCRNLRTVLEPRSSNSVPLSGNQSHDLPWTFQERIHFLLLPASGGCWHSSTCGHINLTSASVVTMPPPPLLCAIDLCLSFVRILNTEFWVHQDNLGWWLPVKNLKTLYPYMVILADSRIRTWYLWGLLFSNYGGFPGGKESACQCRRHALDTWSRKSSRAGNGNPLQYSCLGNPMDRGAWQATVHGVAKRVGHDLATKQQ